MNKENELTQSVEEAAESKYPKIHSKHLLLNHQSNREYTRKMTELQEAFIEGQQWQESKQSAEVERLKAENEKLMKHLRLASTWAKVTIYTFLLRLPAQIMVEYNIDADEISDKLDQALSVENFAKEALKTKNHETD